MSGKPVDLVVALNLYVLQCIVEIANSGSEGMAEVMLRFGIERVLVEELQNLSPPSLLELAQCPAILFSVDQERLHGALKDFMDGQGYRSAHRVIAPPRRKS